MAKLHNKKPEETAVVLEDVQFLRATIVPRDAPVKFTVSVLNHSGAFELSEGGAVAVAGRVRLATPEDGSERLALQQPPPQPQDPALLPLDTEDIYKELRLRGYHYGGAFRGIKRSDALGVTGELAWDDNWISFMDTMLQFGIIGVDTRELYLPTRLQRALIDPVAQRRALLAAGGAALRVTRHKHEDVIASGGVELRGVKTSLAPRRAQPQPPPKLERYAFVPYDGALVSGDDAAHCKRAALTVCVQLALENCGALRMRVCEAALDRPAEALLLPAVLDLLDGEPQVRADASVAAGPLSAQYQALLQPLGAQATGKDARAGPPDADAHLLLAADVLARHGAAALQHLAAALHPRGSLLLEEPRDALRLPGAADTLRAAGLLPAARQNAGACDYLLLRRDLPLPAERVVVDVTGPDYEWVEPLKRAVKRAESEDLRVYVVARSALSGALGLGACLRAEPGGAAVRVVLAGDEAPPFAPDCPPYAAQLQRDLAVNVLRGGAWGCYRHLPLAAAEGAALQVQHAYVNTLTRGDLSSLRWVESPLRHAALAPAPRGTVLCQVYYAPLNFRDIMLATGKLPPDALPGNLAGEECILGLEFSGRDPRGRRVMGMVAARGLATTVQADEGFLWEVPDEWSLEEAATVPVAYATAYYALAVRGGMRRGEAVLVHAGSGGVGQAAIAVALRAGCQVFATVGTADKRAFLRERFPALPDANIGNSRDCSFEQLVRSRTRGRGVDLVLNSLAADKLQASVRCLANGGRFLEIGKLDLSNNTPLVSASPLFLDAYTRR